MKQVNSPLMNKAIAFATKIHKGQKRKGKEVPYIQHPLAVALILAKVTDNEAILVAGILHDTVEDCEPYGSVTNEMIAELFNSEVAEYVGDVTEAQPDLSWVERKQLAMDHISKMSEGSQLVKTADVLHNSVDLIADLEEEGEKVWGRFSATKEQTIQRYIKLLSKLGNVWPDNPLLNELAESVTTLKTNHRNKTS